MLAAATPWNEADRLGALLSYDILDTDAEPAFDAVTQAAALICDTPVALVSLVDEDRQWFKSICGLEGLSQTPRSVAACAHTILGDDILEIEDTDGDLRFFDNPFLREHSIRFYAGANLVDAAGFNLGTLCVVDRKPRRLTAQQRRSLAELSKTVIKLIEHRRADRALRQGEKLYRELFQSAAHGLALVTLQSEWVAVNPAFCRMLGYTEAELLALSMHAIVHPDDVSPDLTRYWALLAGEITGYATTKRYIRKDGATVHARLTISVARSPVGEPVHVVAQIEDVTAETAARANAVRLEGLLADAIEAMRDGVAIFGADGRALRVNSAIQRHLVNGRPVFEIGKAFDDIIALFWEDTPTDARKRPIAEIQSIARGLYQEADGNPTEIMLPGGDWYQVRYFKTGDGGRLFVETDITALKRAAEALEAAKDDANSANKAKSIFLAGMSHEIRTPLNGVLGFADMLLEGELTASQRNLTGLLRNAGQTLLALVNDVLDISKIEAGKLELETVATDPLELLQSAASILQAQIVAKGLTLRISGAPDVPRWILGDPTRLRQILLNLLGNALKFTERGAITARLGRIRAQEGDRLRFEIEDTGMGIPANRLDQLFQDFSQVDHSITRRFGGTGLGLAICRRLAQAMGGEVGVTSRLGHGSTFWFTIALTEATEPAPQDHVFQPDPAQPPLDILVAEDVATNRMIIEAMLRKAGHRVTLVENGADAVAAVADGAFDLVLMDVEMPTMDGLTATQAIRALAGERNRLPVIALTAAAMLEDVDKCKACGMDELVTKPIDRKKLFQAITRCVGEQSLEAAGVLG